MTRPSGHILELLDRLIRFDTVSRNSNLALIDFVRGYLKDLGVDSMLVPDQTGKKANLFATIGPEGVPGVVLSGHTDVVPVDGQDWASDPFSPVEKDGKIFGRGTADMKSFLAVALGLAPEIKSRGLSTPVHLAFSYDEEIGCVGVRRLIAALDALPVRPKACFVGEPTDMKVAIAHKGKIAMRCKVRGQSCHSSLAPYGVNAVETAADLVAHLTAMGRRLRNGPLDSDFDPPFTTVHTGTISGGTALNIVPAECEFDFEIRTLPQQPPEELFEEIRSYATKSLLPAMQAVAKAAGIEWERLSGFPGLETPPDSEIATLAKSLSGDNAAAKVSFGTEGGLYQKAGIPTVVCGPGSIDQAHKPNEYVVLDQVARCETFLRRLIDRLDSR